MAQRKSPAKSTKSPAKTKTKRPARKATRTSSTKTRSASTKSKSTSKKKAHPGEQEVTIDRRRGERRGADQSGSAGGSSTSGPKLERRKKVNRRRQIDPTTCERDYSAEEIEFMNALDDYKRASGRMFPTCSEVLEVVRSLGYVKLSPGELAARSGGESAGEPTAAASGSASASDE